MNFRGKNVLITGGSRGIGLAVSEALARKCANITIIARDIERLNKAVDIIKNARMETDQTINGIPLDVTSSRDVMEKIGGFITENGAPDIVINSAGFAHPGNIEDLPLEIFHKTMNVNYFGTVNIIKAVLPAMLEKKTGLIVNISSVSGFLGIYGYTAYSGSKFAVTGFSDALRNELKPRGIDVAIVFPPDTDTEQLAYESKFKPAVTKEIAGSAGLMTPQAVAAGIVRGIERHQYIITPGFEPSMIYWLQNFMGNVTFKVLDHMSLKAYKKYKNGNL
ncbi:SDR family oxidoreductase [Leptolinea tardivitalis]|uniref:3-dehydrosphinganine reductase n=1 Tax=Leptolinea tardivitalis TaxID=229920 RepID=A0A0P6XSA0_9CHLR|nr:SDR family oxidoreductase [Leptolinea tardivitalis]KPL72496.1 hypothetical protein ADM99_05010 [Leptolinea tardivitalis]GAP21220.1 short-chain dehydrogenase of various substrate specificities [Leptolinea tardivitalis]